MNQVNAGAHGGRGPFSLHTLIRAAWFALVAVLLAAGPASRADDGVLTKSGLRWPSDASRVFTSSFGEYRPDRFHAGIDIRTHGTTGFPCFAIADGDIIRAKVSFSGYGKALYLQLPDGRIAVYAHLDRFAEPVEGEVHKLQLQQGGYEVEAFFEPGRFPVRRGDIVAYSGDTGAGPPHLHFEMRHGMNRPYNPVTEGFLPVDSKPPVIRRLALRALDGDSEVEGDVLPVVRRVREGAAEPVKFFGRVGVAAEIVDFQDLTWYRLAVRDIRLYVDGTLRHHTHLDEYDYAENRESRLDFDFELSRSGYKRFRRLYILPPNRLDFYDRSLPGGVLDSQALGPGRHIVQVVATDLAGNEATAVWFLEALAEPVLLPAEGNGPPRFDPDAVPDSPTMQVFVRIVDGLARVEVKGVPPWARAVEIIAAPGPLSQQMTRIGWERWLGRTVLPRDFRGTGRFRVVAYDDSARVEAASTSLDLASFPSDAGGEWTSPDSLFTVSIDPSDLWFDLVAALEVGPPQEGSISRVYSLYPYEHPFAAPYLVNFRSPAGPWDSTAVICYFESNGKWTYLGHARGEGGRTLGAAALSFEAFAVFRDTLAPVIEKLRPRDGDVALTRRPMISAHVEDGLSGLDLRRCGMELDGRPVIWDYDIDAKRLRFRPWEELPPGWHTVRLYAEDAVGNRSEAVSRFRVR